LIGNNSEGLNILRRGKDDRKDELEKGKKINKRQIKRLSNWKVFGKKMSGNEVKKGGPSKGRTVLKFYCSYKEIRENGNWFLGFQVRKKCRDKRSQRKTDFLNVA